MLQHVEEANETVKLRAHVEEEKRIQQYLANQLKEKEETYQELESEIVTLRKEMGKTTITNLKVDKKVEEKPRIHTFD